MPEAMNWMSQNMEIKIIKNPIKKQQLAKIAEKQFGDMVKAVVDVDQEIMAIGGELHADEEVELTEKDDSKREYTWGINLYPEKSDAEWIEFDSMINIKPFYNNRSRDIESSEIKAKIKLVIKKLVIE